VSSYGRVGQRAAAARHARRASGQVGALAGMIAGAESFPNVAQQLLAARGSLESLLVRLVELELGNCLPNQEVRDEVDGLLRTVLGRKSPVRATLRRAADRPGRGSVSTQRKEARHDEQPQLRRPPRGTAAAACPPSRSSRAA
jgi:DNA-binding FrmR family transcriptional regulator